jgi:kynurenine formamidase
MLECGKRNLNAFINDGGKVPGGRADLPRYDDLPAAGQGGRSGWGIFGEADSVGLLNLQDDASVRAAADLVRKGTVFPLNAELDAVNPPLDEDRTMYRHRVLHQPGPGFPDLDYVLDNFFPQISSQWDSLAHVAYTPGVFYNGANDDEVVSGKRNTIDHLARRGIVGRGILLLRTGFLGWYGAQPWRDRKRVAADLRAPGLEHTEDMARYLWDSQVMAVAADNYSVEVWPPAWGPEAAPFGFLHRVLIGQFGMALGELFALDDLSADCADDGVYEFFLASAPLNVRGGIGSPPNALAIK